jgi:hypothetical protein
MVIFKRDNLRFGLLIGLIVPLFSILLYYWWKFSLYTFSEFIYALRTNKPLITAITIPCLLLNVVLFTIYINAKRDQTAKGIFISTILYAVASLLFKFLS